MTRIMVYIDSGLDLPWLFIKKCYLKHNVDGLYLQFYSLQGFPSSVTPDYVPFQIWDSLQVETTILYFWTSVDVSKIY